MLPRKSVVHKLTRSCLRIYGTINTAGHVNLLTLIDSSKAFDEITHTFVLKKLIQLGVSEPFSYLLQDYLTGRTKRVKINNTLSDKMLITSGEHQGSILTPLFFLIYINYLQSVVFSSVALLFADDLKLINGGSPEHLKRLQSDIDSLHFWSTPTCLLYNAKKCSAIEFVPGKNPKKTKVPFLLEVQFLERKTSSKVVKHIFNESLNWNEQVKYRRSKAFNRLFRLKRNTLQSLIITAKVLLYRAITILILLFGSEYWELKKTEHNSFKNFNAEALKWTYGNMNYIDSVFSTNLLPPFSTRLLRINSYCTVDLQERYSRY